MRPAGLDATAFTLFCPKCGTEEGEFLYKLGMQLVHRGESTRFALTVVNVDDVYSWWLTFCSNGPRPLSNVRRAVRSWLDKDYRAPKEYEIFTLTPAIQRRLGWGDARTDDAFVSALLNELHALKWHPMTGHTSRDSCMFTQARVDLAVEELPCRVPGIDLPYRFLTCDAQHTKYKEALANIGNGGRWCGHHWAVPDPTTFVPSVGLSSIDDAMPRFSLEGTMSRLSLGDMASRPSLENGSRPSLEDAQAIQDNKLAMQSIQDQQKFD